MSKHTPGPWRAVLDNADEPEVVGPRHTVVDAEYTDGYAEFICKCFGFAHGESHANAKLIAAAPDLFEALTKLREAVSYIRPNVALVIAATLADAALDKATS